MLQKIKCNCGRSLPEYELYQALIAKIEGTKYTKKDVFEWLNLDIKKTCCRSSLITAVDFWKILNVG